LGGNTVQQLSVVTKTRWSTLETREVMPVRFTQLEKMMA
jgi:hypothetical protein